MLMTNQFIFQIVLLIKLIYMQTNKFCIIPNTSIITAENDFLPNIGENIFSIDKKLDTNSQKDITANNGDLDFVLSELNSNNNDFFDQFFDFPHFSNLSNSSGILMDNTIDQIHQEKSFPTKNIPIDKIQIDFLPPTGNLFYNETKTNEQYHLSSTPDPTSLRYSQYENTSEYLSSTSSTQQFYYEQQNLYSDQHKFVDDFLTNLNTQNDEYVNFSTQNYLGNDQLSEYHQNMNSIIPLQSSESQVNECYRHTNTDPILSPHGNQTNAQVSDTNYFSRNPNFVEKTKINDFEQDKDSVGIGFSNEINKMYHTVRSYQNLTNAFVRDRKTIIEYLIQNNGFISQLNKIIFHDEFNLKNSSFLNLLEKKIDDLVKITKMKIRSKKNEFVHYRNLLTLKTCNNSNYCFFCKRNKCQFFSPTYKYSIKQFEFFCKCLNLQSKDKIEIEKLNFFMMLDDMIRKSRTCNLNFFLNSFMKSFQIFFKFLDIIQITKPRISRRLKIELANEMFHNFKCHHSKIKIQLIPEFIPLLLLILNRDIKPYYGKSNTLFIVFLFYFHSFNHIFDIIARYNLFEEKKDNDDRKCIEMHRNLISLLVRINFIEPIAMLFLKSEKAVLKYRFHALSLFHIKCLSLQNKAYDRQKMAFLEESMCWILNSSEQFYSDIFHEIYEQNNLKLFFQANQLSFKLLVKNMLHIKQNEPFLNSKFFLEDKNCANYRNFLQNCEIQFAEFKKNK